MQNIPYDSLINEYTAQAERILKDNLVGVYLHGSAAMGCFRPEKSDLDLLVVVERPLSDPVKRAFLDMTVRLNAQGPHKGIEMSIVLRRDLKPFVYPTPYELHFSAGHLDWYRSDPDDYIRRMNGTDKDLAAHCTILKTRGVCLCGAPIDAVLSEVPKEDYLDAILYDVEHAEEEITAYPLYLTLNLARVLAFQEEGRVLSKKEGGEWAQTRLPAEFRPLLIAALKDYCDNAAVTYDEVILKRYARYVRERISCARVART